VSTIVLKVRQEPSNPSPRLLGLMLLAALAFCLGMDTSSMNMIDIASEVFLQLQKRQELQSRPRYEAIWTALLKRAQRANAAATTAASSSTG
jgi:hypothetical protein